MISDIQDSGPMSSEEDFTQLVQQGIAEGVIGGIVAFMTKNNVNLKPTKSCLEPLKRFTAILLAEYTSEVSDFPFPESFKEFVHEETQRDNQELMKLYAHRELDNMRGWCHLIGGAAVAKFLERHRELTLKTICRIRES